MNFSYSLPAMLIGAAVVVVQPQIAVALTPAEVSAIGKEFTVRIDGDGLGSGVIFERKGDKYYVVTNRHVVYKDGRYEIQTQDGSRYPVYYSQELPGLDLVVLEFKSNKSYRIAELGNSDQMREGITVYVVGWAAPLLGIDERSYQITDGIIRSRLQKPNDGYALVYNNEAIPGMSGGPMLDENGRVVGINGRATPQSDTGTVLRLGIPIKTFLAARNNLRPPTGSSPTTTQEPGARKTPTNARQANARETPTAARRPSAEEFISLGGSKANKQDYRGAIANYNQALQINPNNPDAYFQRGVAHYQLGNKQATIKDFNQVLRLTPKNPLAYLIRGSVRGELKDYQGAIKDLNQGISLNPNNHFIYYSRGFVRNSMGDTKGAIADYDQVIRLKPDYADAYKERGNVRYNLKDYQGAVADYNQALSYLEFSGIGAQIGSNEQNKGLIITGIVENSPASKGGVKAGDQILAIDGESTLNKSEEELNLLINNRIRGKAGTQVTLRIRREGRNDFAVRLTRSQITNPESTIVYSQRGLSRVQLGDNQGAIADSSEAIQRNPNYAEAYAVRGIARYGQGDKPKGIEDLQKAADLFRQQGRRGEYQEVLDAIRKVQNTASASQPATTSNQEDNQSAFAASNQAIQRNPNDATAYFNRAVARYNQGDKQAAFEDLNQATRLNPRYSQAWYSRGWVLGELKRNEEAITSYDRAIQANNEWGNSSLADAYLNRAIARSDRGDSRRAIADFDQVIRLNPKNAVAYALRGLNHQRRGKNQAAIADFNQAIRLDPNNALAYAVRGLTYHLQGDYQGALAAYEKAVAQDAKLLVTVNNIGLIKYELGDVEGAIRQWQASVNTDSKSAEPQLALAVALYTKGDRERGLAMAEAALRLDNSFADLEFLKKNLWGDRLRADAQKLLETPRIRAIPSRTSGVQSR